MKKVQIASVLLALALCLIAFGAGTVSAAEKIKIGILGPFSGSLAFNGGELKKGMMLALDDINAGGAIWPANRSDLRRH